jgi:DNA mismatch repair protein MutS
MTELEKSLPRLINVHAQCIERHGKVVFLHRIVPGGADRSYGIHVAELAGLPQPVIERAKQLLAELEGKAESASASEPPNAVSSGQLSLFDYQTVREMKPKNGSGEAKGLSKTESEILEALRKWDLMNKTPFECMQFLFDIKQKLNQ